ncbi:hypothetical protein DFJ73DRAFT_870248 [Zopfochytrium polystomum]|nr:hypothetical protein DFJ73DRAFT_870248 [Zopfochytrium polystomum]
MPEPLDPLLPVVIVVEAVASGSDDVDAVDAKDGAAARTGDVADAGFAPGSVAAPAPRRICANLSLACSRESRSSASSDAFVFLSCAFSWDSAACADLTRSRAIRSGLNAPPVAASCGGELAPPIPAAAAPAGPPAAGSSLLVAAAAAAAAATDEVPMNSDSSSPTFFRNCPNIMLRGWSSV